MQVADAILDNDVYRGQPWLSILLENDLCKFLTADLHGEWEKEQVFELQNISPPSSYLFSDGTYSNHHFKSSLLFWVFLWSYASAWSPKQFFWWCYLWGKNPTDTSSNTLDMSQLFCNLYHLSSVYQVKWSLEAAQDGKNMLLQPYLKTVCQFQKVENRLIILEIGFTCYLLPSSISIKKIPWFWLRNQPSKQRQSFSGERKVTLILIIWMRICLFKHDM